jgi:DNA-binding MarR family transcriptional regulator
MIVNADEKKLLLQASIVATMMLALARGFHGDYRNKHVGRVWEELLVCFVLWKTDTALEPMTALGISRYLGIPRSNVSRAIDALIDGGLVRKVHRRYGRDTDFISARPNSRFFREIREAIVTAGSQLQDVFRE